MFYIQLRTGFSKRSLERNRHPNSRGRFFGQIGEKRSKTSFRYIHA